MHGLYPVSTVSARNTWHNDPLLCPNSEEKRVADYESYGSKTNKAVYILTFLNYDADASQLLKILVWKDLDCQQNTQQEIVMALKFSQHNTSLTT